MSHTPYFSIVIPALNEAEYLPHLLRDLANQTWRDFDVTLVDAESEDETVAKAKQITGLPEFTVLTSSQRNVSAQRNQGASQAKGDWIVFMDADNRLAANYLERLQAKLLERHETDVFTSWTNPDDDTQVSKAVSNALNLALVVYDMIGQPVCLGALIGCRREVLQKVTFDEQQKVLEDGWFIRNAIKQGFGFRIFREPKFTYSLRRLRQEGTIKLAAKLARMQMAYLQGKQFHDEDFGYKMLGGQVYTLAKQTDDFIWKLPGVLQQSAVKRLIKTKQFTEKLQKYFS